MKTRLLPLLLLFVLIASACGADDEPLDAGAADPTAPVVDTDGSGDSDDDSDIGGNRGWIDGAPTDAATGGATFSGDDGSDGGDDGAAEELTYRSDLDGLADEAAPGLLEPPIDPLPPVDEPLRAGAINDADDVAGYLDYRDSILSAGVQVRPLDVADSTVFRVVGASGLPVLDAEVLIWDAASREPGDTEPARTLHTRADGTVRFLPSTLDDPAAQLEIEVRVGDDVTPVPGYSRGVAEVTVDVGADGGHDGSVPLDIVFVLDATGSMGDEIAQLRENMTSVAQQIDALPSAPDVRFGMTVYRDEGDAYVTRTFDLTDSLADFLDALDAVRAEGGGDYAEAMDEALDDAMQLPDWRRQGAVQLMFLIADAPPQVGRNVEVGHTDTAVAAAESGVKIFPVAASGTDDQAEYAMRELAFVTGGRFVFLSYGGGGTATGSGTDITPDEYDELLLDQLIVKLVEDELAALTGDEPGQGQTVTTTVPPPSTTVPIDGQ